MFTSNYAALKLILPPARPVSISRGKPRWLKGGWLAHCQPGAPGRNYDALAPSAAALKGSEEDYHRAFAQLLAGLDPARVYAELGENAVLLCFCAPGCFCHRRIVAEWFEAALGVMVPELGDDPHDGDTQLWTTTAYAHYMDLEQKQAWYDTLKEPAAAGPFAAAPERTPAPRRQIGTRQTWNPATGQWEPSK